MHLHPPARPECRTQVAASNAVAPYTPTMRERVLAYLLERGSEGATIEEIAGALGMRVSSVCGRVNELRKVDRIRDRGVTRANQSGVQAIVWVAYIENGESPCNQLK